MLIFNSRLSNVSTSLFPTFGSTWQYLWWWSACSAPSCRWARAPLRRCPGGWCRWRCSAPAPTPPGWQGRPRKGRSWRCPNCWPPKEWPPLGWESANWPRPGVLTIGVLFWCWCIFYSSNRKWWSELGSHCWVQFFPSNWASAKRFVSISAFWASVCELVSSDMLGATLLAGSSILGAVAGVKGRPLGSGFGTGAGSAGKVGSEDLLGPCLGVLSSESETPVAWGFSENQEPQLFLEKPKDIERWQSINQPTNQPSCLWIVRHRWLGM